MQNADPKLAQMPNLIPSTPEKQKGTERGTQELASCLKSSEKGRLSPHSHKHSTSQVRFSIPLAEDSQSSLDEGDSEPVRSSPNKVVFPKSSEESMRTHFINFHSKAVVDVPEEIWQSHTSHNSQDHLSTTQSPQKGHRRTQSLQSVIAETIQGYNKPVQNNSAKPLSHTPPRLKPSELYLRSDSPLNKYKVPIPLEVSLPPYLSPDKRTERRNSMIYDGEGYSIFLGEDHESDDQDNKDHDQSNLETSSNYSIARGSSDTSIPSAVHDFSFEANEDVDNILGIDQDANVSLKKQARNLLTQSSPDKLHIKHPALPKPPVLKFINNNTDVDEEKDSAHERRVESDALKILASPSKSITIPDFDKAMPLSKRNSLAEFLAKMELETSEDPYSANPQGTDEINENFQFPATEPDAPSKDGAASADFLNVTEGPEDNSFERRRKMLQEQKSSKGRTFKHTHARSRSIYNSQDLFGEQAFSTEASVHLDTPSKSSSGKEIASFTSLDESSSSEDLGADSILVPAEQEQSVAPLDASCAPDEGDAFSFVSSNPDDDSNYQNSEIQNMRSSFEPPDEAVENASKDHIVVRKGSHPEDTGRVTSLAKDFFSQAHTSDLDVSNSSISSHGSIEKVGLCKAELAKSPQVGCSSFNENVTPLSTYNSFKNPLHPPSVSISPASMVAKPIEVNILCPLRQLSNDRSQSSYDSKETLPSQQSSITAYSHHEWPQANEIFKSIPKKKNNSFVAGYQQTAPHAVISNLTEESRNEFKISKERIGGEMVDVILLDDSDDDVQPVSRRPRSFHEDALEHYHEILAMCDMTADRAKEIITDLVSARHLSNKRDKALSRPLPTLPMTESKQKILPSMNSPKRKPVPMNTGAEVYLRPSPRKYISNLDKLRMTGTG